MTEIDPQVIVPNFNNPKIRLINLPPKSIGGNHSHERKEAFLTFNSDVVFIYDFDNKQYEVEMAIPTPQIVLVEANIHHKIVNKGHLPADIIEIYTTY